uniref:Erythromycin biosynthesis protein CIII-like C-terminal domain-containing protein n=2 Tax=Alexandrium monilatum TaxID=311494 RepID=A0A7S4SLZ0_9DINO
MCSGVAPVQAGADTVPGRGPSRRPSCSAAMAAPPAEEDGVDQPWHLLKKVPFFQKYLAPNFQCGVNMGGSTDCVRCGMLSGCEAVWYSAMLKNCKYMLECQACEDCSGLVRETGKKGVHRTPLEWALAVTNKSWEVLTPDEHEELCTWMAKVVKMPWEFDPRAWPVPGAGSGRIALIALGSRGDVQPAIALALALLKAGFTVTAFVPSSYESLVKSFQVPVVACADWAFNDPTAMAEGKYEKFIYEAVMSFGPELIVYSPLACIESWVLEEQCKAPAIQFTFQATTLADTPQVWRPLQGWRRLPFDIGLGEINIPNLDQNVVEDRCGRKRPVLMAFSKQVALPQTDRAQTHVTGYWLLDTSRQEAQQDNPLFGGAQRKELEDFLQAGSPPVYIGWGSMTEKSDRMGPLAVRSLKQTGHRGIILGGEAKLSLASLENAPDAAELVPYAQSNILFAQWVSHETLLPRCAMAVHHGGCGTTAAGLRAGVPNIVVPVDFDQPFWAAAVANLGVGVHIKSLQEVTEEELVGAIQTCGEDGVKAAAAALGAKLMAEDGAKKAVEVIQDYLSASRRGVRDSTCAPCCLS